MPLPIYVIKNLTIILVARVLEVQINRLSVVLGSFAVCAQAHH